MSTKPPAKSRQPGRARAHTAPDTLRRQWHILRLVPRGPRTITASLLHERLAAESFNVSVRTIERDLMNLSGHFPLRAHEHKKPYEWFWPERAPQLTVPGLTPTEALSFALIETFLPTLLPGSLLTELKPYFDEAKSCLAVPPKASGKRSWTDKVRVIPPTQPLMPPAVSAEVPHTVYEALLHGRQAEVLYQKRGAPQAVSYTVHPLGLIQRGLVTYLVCTLFQYSDIMLLAVHRIQSATLREEPSSCPRDFDLDAYVGSGAAHFGHGEEIRLSALFRAETGDHLLETPLARDQVVSQAADGWMRVVATVRDTPQLRWWLQAFGDQVRVEGPKTLRDAIREGICNAHQYYEGRAMADCAQKT